MLKGSIVNASCRISLLATPAHLLPANNMWPVVFGKTSMTDKEFANNVVRKLCHVMHSDVVSKLIDDLDLVVGRSQNKETRIDDSIDEDIWNSLRDLVRAADDLRLRVRSNRFS